MKTFVFMAAERQSESRRSCTPIGTIRSASFEQAEKRLRKLGAAVLEVLIPPDASPVLTQAHLLDPSEALLDQLLPPPGASERADRVRTSLRERALELFMAEMPSISE